MNWKKLQNGSDIRGIAIEGVEGEDVNLTPEVVKTLAQSFVKWLREETGTINPTIAVGTDSRISGPVLKASLIEGFIDSGAKVFDCGIASTPAMFMATVDKDRPTTAGIMVTASHLPFNRNGLKFFTKKGGLDKKDISAILAIAESGEFESAEAKGSVDKYDFMDAYASMLVDYIRRGAALPDYNRPLGGMKIVVDAGNGAGGFFATKVLERLGADISGSQFLEPDGMFPNHVPNPEDKKAMQSVCEAVKRNGAQLGIIFDTDVDRSAIVDENGEPINRNSLIALISAIILKEHPGSTVVTDSITSVGLADFIKEHGGVHHRFKRGYKNVINESLRLNGEGIESWLAIETSGHAALKENYFLDDGAFLIAKLLVEAARLNVKGKTLSSLISTLQKPAESKEIRFSIACEDFAEYGKTVLAELPQLIAGIGDWEIVVPNHEGIRISCNGAKEKGWFLLRMSLHDPVMPLNIESGVDGGVSEIEQRLMGILRRYDKLKAS
ncbi:MAG: phosphomannomutase/phosphoglucomutase [Prevotella sp.]|uniref:phosphomannomutase/phosphoglucomutase n=1 Tax=Prevotella sp. TaxID=59823 RepID=UPI002A2B9A97|nr:phosphomannomutase/phosphoglucomutase [Prevotella sp.]MDD7319145.1 phosphomannomutase/phosphoglucomutase [Prevotellaceae bacterium]MDY4020013.1 phosphomannomutase/phosphoglucomutase [Prevotella sp.]